MERKKKWNAPGHSEQKKLVFVVLYAHPEGPPHTVANNQLKIVALKYHKHFLADIGNQPYG